MIELATLRAISRVRRFFVWFQTRLTNLFDEIFENEFDWFDWF